MGWIIEIHQQSIPWIVDGFGLWRNGDKGGTTNLKGGECIGRCVGDQYRKNTKL